MKRAIWSVFGLLMVGTLVAAGYVLFAPKIKTASLSEIEAVLPASLKVQDKSDPVGERRYWRLIELAGKMDKGSLDVLSPPRGKYVSPALLSQTIKRYRSLIAGVEAILAEGSVRFPERKIDSLSPELPKLKSLAKLLAASVTEAASRGDRPEVERLCLLSLRLSQALLEGKGIILESLVAFATESIAMRPIYGAEMANGLDAKGREAILSHFPVENGRFPAFREIIRRDFQRMLLPVIVDPKRLLKITVGDQRFKDGHWVWEEEIPPGTFDPVETAKSAGMIYELRIAEETGESATSGRAEKFAEQVIDGLPNRLDEEGGLREFWYRLRMNSGRNTIGRKFVADFPYLGDLANLARRRAANRNVLRAVLLLRSGKSAAIPDPFGKGDLRVDAKRRLVWSVGENGTDDGGDIAKAFGGRAADIGARY